MSDNEMAKRIRQLRISQNLTLEQVASKVGVGKSTVRKWETGMIQNMRRDKIASLADALRTTPAYLMGWDDTSGILPSNLTPLAPMDQIPLVGDIACGTPILAEENITDYVDLPGHIRADFALTCRGDSMINARIFDGDVVYIRHQDTVDNGEIAAVLIDDEATLKRVRIFEDHIVLEPENPMYKPMVFWGEEMNNVKFLGKAVAFTSAIR